MSPVLGKKPWIRLGAVAITAVVALSACSAGTDGGSAAEGSGGTLTIGMTASNIPLLDTAMSGSEGGEGWRFVGNQLYNGLTQWDLSDPDVVPTIIPALAESWEVSEDLTTWTFTLREGVTFHDGTPFDADAAVYNLGRYVDQGDPQFYPELRAAASEPVAGLKGFSKIDDMTIEITTVGPWANLPSDLATLYFASPTALEELGNDGFLKAPVGTGPFEFVELQEGESLTLASYDDYWAGEAKVDNLVLRPIPDATARVAALRNGEVNWIEVPQPDDKEGLEAAGFTVELNSYDHIWSWLLDTQKEPFNDVRVRQALNYAIDRESLSENLLQGTAEPVAQFVPKANFAYDAANDVYNYDPEKAVELLTEAGYPDGFTITLSYPTGGSGNMLPTPMNEALQADLAKVGIDVVLEPIEWAAMLQDYFVGNMPGGAEAMTISMSLAAEGNWAAYLQSDSATNPPGYDNPEVDALFALAKETGDVDERAAIYTEAGKIITEDAPWLYVVTDLNARAIAPSVHDFEMPQSWYVDLTQLWVE